MAVSNPANLYHSSFFRQMRFTVKQFPNHDTHTLRLVGIVLQEPRQLRPGLLVQVTLQFDELILIGKVEVRQVEHCSSLDRKLELVLLIFKLCIEEAQNPHVVRFPLGTNEEADVLACLPRRSAALRHAGVFHLYEVVDLNFLRSSFSSSLLSTTYILQRSCTPLSHLCKCIFLFFNGS